MLILRVINNFDVVESEAGIPFRRAVLRRRRDFLNVPQRQSVLFFSMMLGWP